jgi:CelD/BcsL family acetyltransferase involved in cellulose biosynthesis
MPRPCPFLLHGWMCERWRHDGRDAVLAVHVAWREGRLVGALPLCRRRRFGLTVTEFIGGTKAQLADLMLAPGEDVATARLLAARAAESSADFADFFGLPGGSRLASAVPGPLAVVERLEAPVLDVTDAWQAVYERRLPAKARSHRRGRRRQLEQLGAVEVSVARTPDELTAALPDTFRLYELRWHRRRNTASFATPDGQRFLRAALLRLGEKDVPRLVTLRVGDRAIAFALHLQLDPILYGVATAFDPAFARFGPGTETLLSSLEIAAGEGVRRVEFLGAGDEHKLRLADRLDPIYEGIGLARTVRGRVAVEALTGGIRLRRRLKRSATARKLYYRLPRFGRT